MLYTVVFSGICCGFLVVPLVVSICGKLVVGRSDAPEEVKQQEANESNNRQK